MSITIYPSSISEPLNVTASSANLLPVTVADLSKVQIGEGAATLAVKITGSSSETVNLYSRNIIGVNDVNFERPIHGTFEIANSNQNRKKLTIYNRSSDDLFLSIVSNDLNSLDAFSIPGPIYDFQDLGITGNAYSFLSTAQGLYIGGNDLFYNEQNLRNLVLYNGQTVVAVGGGVTGSGPAHSVRSLASSSQGIYVGGWGLITASTNIAISNACLWNGSTWTNLSGNSGYLGNNYGVNSLVSSSEGVYAGGLFGSLEDESNSSLKCVALWNGTDWLQLSGGLNNWVYSLASGSEGVYAGGLFSGSYNQEKELQLAAIWDGNTWNSLANGLKLGFVEYGNSYVKTVFSASDGVYYGGGFSGESGSAGTGSSFLRWNGSSWSDVGAFFGDNGFSIIDKILSGSGGIYVSGFFDYVSNSAGVRAGGIAKWDGSNWSSVTVQGNPAFKYDLSEEPDIATSVRSIAFHNNQLYLAPLLSKLTYDNRQLLGPAKLINFSPQQAWDGISEYERTITTTVPISGTYVSDGLQAQLKHYGLLLSGSIAKIFVHEIE